MNTLDFIREKRKERFSYREIGELLKVSKQRIHQLLTGYKSQKRGLQGIDRTREMVRKRDDWTCQDCGKKWVEGKRRFDCHHLNGLCGKKSKKYDKISEMDEMITLCHKCHFNRPEHKTRRKSYPHSV